jgi:tetratricopeptide (TPR) repeat protein
MWRQSGDITQDATLKTLRYQNSLKEYATATSLSPQNAQLFNEWATLLAYSVGDQNGGINKLKQSLVIDSKYDQTYLLLGDMYFQQAQRIEQDRQKAAAANPPDTAKADELKRQYDEKLKESKKIFSQALVVNPNATQVYNVLASIDQQLGNLTDAISATQASIDKNPRDWVGYRNLALLMQQAGQIELAKQAAQKALELAPKDQQPVLQQFVQQLGGK